MQDSLEHRVALIRALPVRARAAALEAAIDASHDPAERERFAIELLELAIRPGLRPKAGPWARRSAYLRQIHADRALSQLCAHWASLAIELRSHAIAVANGRWASVVRDLRHDDRPSARAALCAIAPASADPALFAPLADLLEDAEPQIGRAAGQTLLALTSRELAIDPFSLAPDLGACEEECLAHERIGEPRHELLRVLRTAIARYAEHQQRSVALACLLFVAHDPKASSLASTRVDHAATQALRGVLRWSRSPISRACALRLLNHEALHDAAISRLSRAHDLADHDLTLRQGHLTLNPSRREPLGRIEVRARSTPIAADRSPRARLIMPKESALPDGSWLGVLSEAARRQIPRWLSAFDTDEPTSRALLDPLLADDDETTRLLAMRGASETTLTDFCFDRSESIARSAMTRFSLHGAAHDPSGPIHRRHLDTLSTLVRSPHAPVRRMAREDIARLDPWGSAGAQTALIARRRMNDEPEAFLIDLRHVLMSAPALTRIGAITIARRLGIADRIESLLISLITHAHGPAADERVVASAVSALGTLNTQNARRTVRLVLRHPDARARANAVEAMARQERSLASGKPDANLRSTLTELRGDPNQRVRANAVRSLMALPEPKGGAALYTPSAGSALIAMLRDERPAHRVSGLWVAERASSGPDGSLLGHIQSLAEMDPDRGVRTRAAGVIHRIQVRRGLLGSTLPKAGADNAGADNHGTEIRGEKAGRP